RDSFRGWTKYPLTKGERQIPYPPRNLVEQLLTLKKPGEVITVTDRPGDTYYVTVLLDRTPDLEDKASRGKDLEEFLEVYRNASSAFGGADSLWRAHLMPERQKAYHDKVMTQLRAEAVGDPDKLDRLGQIKLPEGMKGSGDVSGHVPQGGGMP